MREAKDDIEAGIVPDKDVFDRLLQKMGLPVNVMHGRKGKTRLA